MSNNDKDETRTNEILALIGEKSYEQHETMRQTLGVLKHMRLMFAVFILVTLVVPVIVAELNR